MNTNGISTNNAMIYGRIAFQSMKIKSHSEKEAREREGEERE